LYKFYWRFVSSFDFSVLSLPFSSKKEDYPSMNGWSLSLKIGYTHLPWEQEWGSDARGSKLLGLSGSKGSLKALQLRPQVVSDPMSKFMVWVFNLPEIELSENQQWGIFFCFVVVGFVFVFRELEGFLRNTICLFESSVSCSNAMSCKAQWSYFLCRRPVLGFILECWLKLQMAFYLFCTIKVPLTEWRLGAITDVLLRADYWEFNPGFFPSLSTCIWKFAKSKDDPDYGPLLL